MLSVQGTNPRGSEEKIDLGKMKGKKLLMTGAGGERKIGGSGFCVMSESFIFLPMIPPGDPLSPSPAVILSKKNTKPIKILSKIIETRIVESKVMKYFAQI